MRERTKITIDEVVELLEDIDRYGRHLPNATATVDDWMAHSTSRRPGYATLPERLGRPRDTSTSSC